MTKKPDDLTSYIQEEFANRTELGAVFWLHSTGSRNPHAYSYAETIAISHLIIRGWSLDEATGVVDAGLVIAVPHVPGVMSAKIAVPDFVYCVGYTKLADGVIWEVLGDLDLPHAHDFITEHSSTHGAVAVRNLEVSDEPFEERIMQLMSTGNVEAHGRFVAEVRRLAPLTGKSEAAAPRV